MSLISHHPIRLRPAHHSGEAGLLQTAERAASDTAAGLAVGIAEPSAAFQDAVEFAVEDA